MKYVIRTPITYTVCCSFTVCLLPNCNWLVKLFSFFECFLHCGSQFVLSPFFQIGFSTLLTVRVVGVTTEHFKE